MAFEFHIIDVARGKRVVKVKIMLGTEVGNFDISGTAPKEGEVLLDTQIPSLFDQEKTIDLGIFIEDDYKKQGWSTSMIATMVESIGNRMADDQQLFIDVDASEGFWKHIGFRENRYFRDTPRALVGQGYEAYITWRDLKLYCAKKITL
jgi:hypothetical protein